MSFREIKVADIRRRVRLASLLKRDLNIVV